MSNSLSPKQNIIGIFDSGVGGFSVLEEVVKETSAPIIYYGDCARAPYGNRPLSEITLFIKELLTHLQERGVTHFVSACNSMSVLTTNVLLEECHIEESNYVDMIRAFKKWFDAPKGSSVLILGTQATVISGEYQFYLERNGYRVFEYVPHDLARAIEESRDKETIVAMIKPALLYAQAVGVTHILFCCTHYPLVKDIFTEVASLCLWKGEFVDPACFVRQEVSSWNLADEKQTILFETSKETDAFKQFSGRYRQSS